MKPNEGKRNPGEGILLETKGEISKSTSATQLGKVEQVEEGVTAFDAEKDLEKLDDAQWSNMKISTQDKAVEDEPGSEDYLVEDSYSVIFVASYASLTFLYAACTIFVQMAITFALLWDVFRAGDDGNPIGVPPDVPPSVRMVAFLTLMVAPGFMEDFLTAISFLSQGYDSRVISQKPHATFTKFMLAGTLQLITGLGLLATIFALIMQSDTVLGLMLNYAALHFVSEIDNLAFRMAKDGYITTQVQREIEGVKKVSVSAPGPRAQMARRIAYALACFLLLGGYVRLTRKQDSGKYLCKKLFLQLGDGFNHRAAAFSGVYQQAGKTSGLNSRVIYSDPTDFTKLGYCDNDSTWTLVALDEAAKAFDPCSDDWVVKSSHSEGYDVTDVADTPWFVSIDGRRVEVIDHFIMKCIDCDLNPIAGRSCSGSGTCIDNACVCDDGYAGLQCEFPSPCEELTLDFRQPYFPLSVNSIRHGDEVVGVGVYDLLRRNDTSSSYVEVYNRPVYVESTETDDDFATLLVYLGRRWVVTAEYKKDVLYEEVEGIHGAFKPPSISFVSEAVDQGTQGDSLSPVGLAWYQPEGNTLEGLLGRADASQPIATRFVCSICDGSADIFQPASNPCFVGECTESSFCYCGNRNNVTIPSEGTLYMGSLCEEAAYYNTYYVQDGNATMVRLEVKTNLFENWYYYEWVADSDRWYRWYPDFNGDSYPDPSFMFNINWV